MAEVFKVWHTGLHRFEAMKSLLPSLGSDALFVQRFLHEARIAAALSHPHIAAIYNVSPDDAPRPFFTMEFIEGGDLADLLERSGKMSLEQAISLLIPTADALDYAHARGVVHRDVKPGNVLLHTTSRSDWSAKVVDFGIARAQEEHGGTRLTKAGLIVGTPEYMSPEQAGNGQPVDHRTDLYSLGVIAYEMVCGHPPFWVQGNLSSLSVIASHLRDDPPPPRQHDPSLPASVNDAILKALAKNPDDRFSTCGEFIEALAGDVPAVSLALANGSATASEALLENGSPATTIAVLNTRDGNHLANGEAADRDTDFIAAATTTFGPTGKSIKASTAPNAVTKSKKYQKWLWPALAALIGALFLAVQFTSDTTSTSDVDPTLTATPLATNLAPTVSANTATQSTVRPAPTATAPKVIKRVRIEVSRQTLKFSAVRRLTANLLVGQQRIAQPGQNGVRQVSAQVTTRDGREIARRILRVQVLKHSVPQIVLIGTRKATALSSSSRSTRRVPVQRSNSATSIRDNGSTARRSFPRRSSVRRGSTRRSAHSSKRRTRRRESSLPIVESPLPR